jgi:hypothetical protein
MRLAMICVLAALDSKLLDAYGYATAVPNVVGPVHYFKNQTCWFYISANSAYSALGSGFTNAFADPGKYVVGNSGRNTLRGPNTQVFDAALIKAIRIHENWNAEARWETFNVANHALFGQPSGNVSSGSAGIHYFTFRRSSCHAICHSPKLVGIRRAVAGSVAPRRKGAS